MSLSGFRIACDLSDFFCDIRSKAFLYIDLSKDRIIQDIISRIQDTFNLNFFISLAVNGSYLPGSEDVRVLHECDEVKVFKTQLGPSLPVCADNTSNGNSLGESPSIRLKKRCRPSKTKDVEEETSFAECTSDTTSVPKDKKRKVKKGDHEKHAEHRSAECNNTIQHIHPLQLNEPSESKSDSVESSNDLAIEKQQEACAESLSGEVECTNKKKRKRTRIRKRSRKTPNQDIEAAEEPGISKQWSYSSAESFIGGQAVAVSNKTHTRFTNELEKVLPNGLSSDKDKPSEMCELPSSSIANNRSKTCLATESKALMSHVSSVFTMEAKINHSVNTVPTEENGSSILPFDKILSLCNSVPIIVKRKKPAPPSIEEKVLPAQSLLEKMPTGNEVISFKVLKMDNNYCPHLSAPIRAKVIGCDSVTQQLTLKVLDGLDQCQQPQGIFSIDDDLENTSNPSDIVEYNWQELIEPYSFIDVY